MTEKNDGGRAFPVMARSSDYAQGMSLRDWFAGQALSGSFGRAHWIVADSQSHASWAYEIADAMIAARDK